MSCDIEYFIGQKIRFRFNFKDDAGALADPSALRFKYRKPEDTVATTLTYGTDAEWARESLGIFHVDLDIDEAGLWRWRLETDGVETADQGSFRVLPENV